MKPKLIVTGTIGVDTIETPYDRKEGVPGGSAAYFAVAASQFAPVGLVAVVGGDWPQEHSDQLSCFSGICLNGVEKRSEGITFSWGGRYGDNPNDRETLYTTLGVLEEKPPAIPDSYKNSKIVFLANSHPDVQAQFLNSFSEVEFVVMDTMNLWIDIANSNLKDLIQRVNGLILNDEEAEMLTGKKHPVQSGQAILEMGPEFAIVKKGEHGAVLVHKDGLGVVPAYPLSVEEVVDPTGAGDAFAGGLMGSLVAKDAYDLGALRESMIDASSVASHIVEGFGFSGLKGHDIEEILNRKRAFKSMMGI